MTFDPSFDLQHHSSTTFLQLNVVLDEWDDSFRWNHQWIMFHSWSIHRPLTGRWNCFVQRNNSFIDLLSMNNPRINCCSADNFFIQWKWRNWWIMRSIDPFIKNGSCFVATKHIKSYHLFIGPTISNRSLWSNINEMSLDKRSIEWNNWWIELIVRFYCFIWLIFPSIWLIDGHHLSKDDASTIEWSISIVCLTIDQWRCNVIGQRMVIVGDVFLKFNVLPWSSFLWLFLLKIKA